MLLIGLGAAIVILAVLLLWHEWAVGRLSPLETALLNQQQIEPLPESANKEKVLLIGGEPVLLFHREQRVAYYFPVVSNRRVVLLEMETIPFRSALGYLGAAVGIGAYVAAMSVAGHPIFVGWWGYIVGGAAGIFVARLVVLLIERRLFDPTAMLSQRLQSFRTEAVASGFVTEAENLEELKSVARTTLEFNPSNTHSIDIDDLPRTVEIACIDGTSYCLHLGKVRRADVDGISAGFQEFSQSLPPRPAIGAAALTEIEKAQARETYARLPDVRLEELIKRPADLRPGALELIVEELDRRRLREPDDEPSVN
jgi:hypothetical protein